MSGCCCGCGFSSRFGAAGGDTWAAVLAAGNLSGGTDPTLTTGDTYTAEPGADVQMSGGALSGGLAGGLVFLAAGNYTSAGVYGFFVNLGDADPTAASWGKGYQFTAGDAGTSGDGGQFEVYCGQGGTTGGGGGFVNIKAGDCRAFGQGGRMWLLAGSAQLGSGGNGGEALLQAGIGDAGAGGRAAVEAGDSRTSIGGNLDLLAGDSLGSAPGGAATLRAGNGGAFGGQMTIAAGSGTGAASAGGQVSISAGAGTGAAIGGQALLTAGNSATGNAGDVVLTAGTSSGGTGNGGDVIVRPGGTAGGANGTFRIDSPILAYDYVWPNADGAPGEFLQTDGATGALGWSAPGQETINYSATSTQTAFASVAYYNRLVAGNGMRVNSVEFDLAVAVGATNVEVGIYDDAGNLLQKSAPTPVTAAGFYTVSLPAPVTMAKGTAYWVALWVAGNLSIKAFTAPGASGVRTQQGGLGTLPNPFTPFANQNTFLPWLLTG